MKLSDVKIGDKFYHCQLNGQNVSDRMYLRIDMNPSILFKHVQLPHDTVAAIDLFTYKVICLNGNYEVEVEHDNVFI